MKTIVISAALAAFLSLAADGTRAFVDVFNHWKVWKSEQLQRDSWPEFVAREAVQLLINRRAEEKRQKTMVIER
ncbi:MAG: hypothetical protein QOE70_3272 [Chthoniobacter sp.]|nr:hypothetical protein [Chthoniobacter sp.]